MPREESSPFTSLFHLLDDLRYQRFVIFLGILLIQNAVLLVLQGETTKAGAAGKTVAAIDIFSTVPARITADSMEKIRDTYTFIAEFTAIESRVVHI